MSPVAAAMFTCTTSAEVKMAYSSVRKHDTAIQRSHGVAGEIRVKARSRVVAGKRTWWGRTRDKLILSAASAYPLLPSAKVLGALRAAEVTRRSADISFMADRVVRNSQLVFPLCPLTGNAGASHHVINPTLQSAQTT